MRREFPVGPHDDGRLLEPQGRDPVHHRRDPQARGFPPGTLSWVPPSRNYFLILVGAAVSII